MVTSPHLTLTSPHLTLPYLFPLFPYLLPHLPSHLLPYLTSYPTPYLSPLTSPHLTPHLLSLTSSYSLQETDGRGHLVVSRHGSDRSRHCVLRFDSFQKKQQGSEPWLFLSYPGGRWRGRAIVAHRCPANDARLPLRYIAHVRIETFRP